MSQTPVARNKDKLSRKKAEKIIATTQDVAVLGEERFTKHSNKHVKAKAAHKVQKLQGGQDAAQEPEPEAASAS